MALEEGLHLGQGQYALGRLGQQALEDVGHPFVDVQLHLDAGRVERLVQADRIAEEDLPRAGLDQRGREALAKVRAQSVAFAPFLAVTPLIARERWNLTLARRRSSRKASAGDQNRQ